MSQEEATPAPPFFPLMTRIGTHHFFKGPGPENSRVGPVPEPGQSVLALGWPCQALPGELRHLLSKLSGSRIIILCVIPKEPNLFT